MSQASPLPHYPWHLSPGGFQRQPEFDGSPDWYVEYEKQHQDDGSAGYLVSQHTFDAPWDVWEVHPNGEELMVCVAGEIVLIQEISDEVVRTVLGPGETLVNRAGVWHTADAEGPATAIFITSGLGTQHRPR